MISQRRFLKLAQDHAAWSPDPSTKCGCVLTNVRNNVLSLGHNHFADGLVATPGLYADREQKLRRVVHAEMDALKNVTAYQYGGIYAYITDIPCDRCAAHLLHYGVRQIYVPLVPADGGRMRERWAESIAYTKKMFTEAGAYLHFIDTGIDDDA